MKKTEMKKLALHKQTVRLLTERDMRNVAGGLSSPHTCAYSQSCPCSNLGCGVTTGSKGCGDTSGYSDC
jgi:hypothetical protein